MTSPEKYHQTLLCLRENLAELEREFQRRKANLESKIRHIDSLLSSEQRLIEEECPERIESILYEASREKESRTPLWRRVVNWRNGDLSEFTVREAIIGVEATGPSLGKYDHSLMWQALKKKFRAFRRTKKGFAMIEGADRLRVEVLPTLRRAKRATK